MPLKNYAKNNPNGCDSKYLKPNTKETPPAKKKQKAFSIGNVSMESDWNISRGCENQAVALPVKPNRLLHSITIFFQTC